MRAGALLLLGAIVALDTPAAQEAESLRPGDITLLVTVTDADGHLVRGLHRDDFIVYEDEAPQTVTSLAAGAGPVSLGFLWDAGAPIVDRIGMTQVQTTLLRFAINRFEAGGEMFVAEFSGDGTRLLQGWTSDRARLGFAIGSLRAAGRPEETTAFDAMATSLPIAAGGRHGTRMLLVLSGNLDRDRSATPYTVLLRTLPRTGIVVHGWMGGGTEPAAADCPVDRICPNALSDGSHPCEGPACGAARDYSPAAVTSSRVARVVAVTGGRVEPVATAVDFMAALVRLERELEGAYRVGYAPVPPADGRSRAVRVVLRDPTLRARSRPSLVY